MLVDNESLWPDDLVVAVDTFMVSILRRQARLLSQITRNILKGEVESTGSPHPSDALRHSFYIKAVMLLGAPRYRLFYVTQGGLSAYPVEIHSSIFAGGYCEATTEQEFRKALRDILNSEETKGVIRSLLDASQS